MLQIGVTSIASQSRETRDILRDHLAQEGIEPEHVRVIEAVAQEMLDAAFDSGIIDPVILTVEPAGRVTKVSVKTPHAIEVRDEPFLLRAHILEALALSVGQTQHPDGTIELCADVARSL